MKPDLRVAADPRALVEQAAELTLAALARALEARGRARWVLAGGTTPLALYRWLAGRPRALDWSRVQFYWGDERCVGPEDAASNYRAARETLLAPLAIAPRHWHRIEGELDPSAAAARYGERIEAVLDQDTWDLVLLGLGADGHTASLFPPREAVAASAWAVPATAPSAPRSRVSMTVAALARSRRTLFLVSGAAKAPALARVFAGDTNLHASLLATHSPRVSWCVDRAAAGGLTAAVQSSS